MSEVGVAYVRLLPSARGFGQAAAGELRGEVGPAADEASKTVSDKFGAVGATMTRAGKGLTMGLTLPIVGFGAATLSAAGSFEAGMRRVGVLSGATGDELQAMEDLARDLGSTTMFSATEAADALGFLSMAGFEASESMDALPGVLDLAAAGQMDLAETADIASNALSGFGLEADQIDHLADVMANTISSANTDMRQLGEAMSFVAPVAASAGISMEETSAAIGLMGDAGIQGSRAGTALTGAITRLLTPSGEAASALGRLGVEVTDAGGEMLPMVDIVRQLEESGADTADMMTIFGQRAGPAMAALVEQGSDALGELTDANMDAAGRAAELADVEMEGFQGAMAGLRSAFEGLMIAIADSGLIEWVTSAVQSFSEWIRSLSDTNPHLLKLGVIVAGVLAAVGPLALIIGKLIGTVLAVAKGMGMLVAAGKAVVVVIRAITLAMAANPLGLLLTGIALLIAGLILAYRNSETFRNIVQAVFRAVGAAAMWLWDNAIKPLWEGLKVGFAFVVAAAKLWWEGVKFYFGLVASIATWLWESVLSPVWDLVKAGFDFVVQAAKLWWEGVKIIWKRVADGARQLWERIKSAFDRAREIFANVVGWVRDMWDRAKSRFDQLVSFVRGIPGRIKAGLGDLKERFLAPFRAAFNAVAGLWNDTLGSWSISVPSWVPGVGGNTWSMPSIPTAARGGIFDPQPGGVLAVLAEAGVREVAMPEPDLDRLLARAVAAGPVGADSPEIAETPEVRVFIGDRELTDIVDVQISRRQRSTIRRTRAGAGRAA